MNEHVKGFAARARRLPTQAAEGLPRWRWTTAELEKAAAAGFFAGEDGFELIGGEMVPMSPNGRRHDLVCEVLERHLRRQETVEAHVTGEKQLNLTADTYTKPDIIIRPAAVMPPDLSGESVLLVVEVADTSLDADLGIKARTYATHGVREYWVIEAWSLNIHVHRGPDMANGRYTSVEVIEPGARQSLLLVPAIQVVMPDLGL